MKKIILSAFILFSYKASALQLDEKLTLRILELSKTKKTALVNRGMEDGLVIGDHAKFFLTTGVVARGVVVKASPSRTIWSLYRLIDQKYIEKDKVMNLKISTPVKLTKDSSKSLREESRVSAIPMADGADDIPEDMKKGLDDSDKSDLAALGSMGDNGPSYTMASGRSSKTWEVYGLFNMSSLSGTYDDGTNSDTAVNSSMDITGGVEKYFTGSGFLQNLSLSGFVNSRSSSVGQDTQSTLTFLDLGASLNYHFFNSPLSYSRPIGFGTVSFGQGLAESKSITAGVESDPVSGASSFYSFGGGMKYILKNGFGARAMAEYYSSSSTFSFEEIKVGSITGKIKRELSLPSEYLIPKSNSDKLFLRNVDLPVPLEPHTVIAL